MRYLLFFILFAILLTILPGCYDSGSGVGNPFPSSDGQFAWVESAVVNDGHDNYSSMVSGSIYGSPLPIVTSYSLNDSVYAGYTEYPGFVSIHEEKQNYDLAPANSALRINTSAGTLTATLRRPDSVSTIATNIIDSVRVGHPVTLSWNSANADFYFLGLEYTNMDSSDYNHRYGIDTIVTGNSVTFPGNIFKGDGYITLYSFVSVNGPLPQIGSAGNISGAGTGFYYYSNGTMYPLPEFPVGRYRLAAKRNATSKYDHERFQAYLQKRLGLDVMNGNSTTVTPVTPTATGAAQFVVAEATILGQPNLGAAFYEVSAHANRIPRMVSIKLNDTTVHPTVPDFWGWSPYPLEFYHENLNFATPHLTMQVTTSVGTVSGAITKPDTVTAITYSLSDTLPRSTPFTMSWSGSNADFYLLTVQYNSFYADSNSFYLDTFVVGNTLTISADKFPTNGELYLNGPLPINGPLPRAGAVANASGAGIGFFYYRNESATLNKTIIVGTGGYGIPQNPSAHPVHREHFLNTIQKALGVQNPVAMSTE